MWSICSFHIDMVNVFSPLRIHVTRISFLLRFMCLNGFSYFDVSFSAQLFISVFFLFIVSGKALHCIALHAHRTVRQKKGKLIPRDMFACNLLSKRSVMKRIWYWVNIDREKKWTWPWSNPQHIYLCLLLLPVDMHHLLHAFFLSVFFFGFSFLLSFRYLWPVHTYIVRDKRSRVGTCVLQRLNTYWKFLFFSLPEKCYTVNIYENTFNLSKYMWLNKSIWSHKH